MSLNEIGDNRGAMTRGRRVGRGRGSGRAKNGGRGHKGQKAREGVHLGSFEGGQMPLHRRVPKRGFTNVDFKKRYEIVNLDDLQRAVERGRLDPSGEIDQERLRAAGVIGKKGRDGVRVLGRGELNTALTLKVAGASQAARQAVSAAGGEIRESGAQR